MLAVALALASSIAYGCADFAGGLAARGTHVLRVIAIAAPVSLVLVVALIPAAGAEFSREAVLWGAGSGLAAAVALALLYLTLAYGPMSVLSPITALVSGALPVAVGLAAGEDLGALGAAGVVLAAFAVIMVSGGPDERVTRPQAIAVGLAFGAGAAVAVQLVFLDQAPSDSGIAPLVAGRAVASALTLAAFFALRPAATAGRNPLWLAAAAGALDSIANLAFLLAVREGELALVSVITALYPAATLVLARALLSERISPIQTAGLAVAAGAVVMLALS